MDNYDGDGDDDDNWQWIREFSGSRQKMGENGSEMHSTEKGITRETWENMN